MFNLIGGTKTIVRQGEKIREQENKLFAKEQLMRELCSENVELYAENKALRIEKADLINAKDIAEQRNVEYARLIKALSEELKVNQFDSVLNLQNKIKSMLAECPGKHC